LTEYRFPSEQQKYLQSVGKILPRILEKIFNELGFGVWINPGPVNGVDLKLFGNENRLVLVAEILNWSPYTILFRERKGCIIHNLSFYDCRRVLIYTAMSNEDFLDDLSDYDISTLRIGYQVLTKKSYDFYEARNQVIDRKIYNRSVKRDIKLKIEDYLESSGIHPLYVANQDNQ
jgi:hypothetical protein